MKIKINLFQKLFLYSISLIILIFFISFSMTKIIIDKYYITNKEKKIIDISDNVKKLSVDFDILDNYIEEIKNKQGIYIELLQPVTTTIYSTENKFSSYNSLDEGFQIIDNNENSVTLLVFKEILPSGYVIIISTSITLFSNFKEEFLYISLITFFISLIIGIILSHIFSRRLTGNIKKINNLTKEISQLNFKEKLNINSNDEIESLSKNINSMSFILEKSINNLKNFVSNASHELKTPISVINLYSQRLLNDDLDSLQRKKYYKTILKESKAMNELIQNLLLLTKLDVTSQNENLDYCDLDSIVHKSIEKYEFLELEKDICYSLELTPKKIFINENLFQIVVDNLVQNALKYSPDNSCISIKVSDTHFTIINDMVGEIQDKKQLFQPFYRENSNISGYGLGLSIIKSILELYNFKYSIKTEKNYFIFEIDILMT